MRTTRRIETGADTLHRCIVALAMAVLAAGVVSALLLTGPGLAQAQTGRTVYVSPGDSIARAIARAGSGGRVIVRGGSYPPLTVSGGSRTAAVTVAAAKGENVSLPSILVTNSASWLRFVGLHLTGDSSRPSFRVQEGRSRHVALVRSDVRSDNQDAVDVRWGADHVLIEGNTVHVSGGGNGIVQSSSAPRHGVPDPGTEAKPPVSNMVIRDNRITRAGTDAIRPANFEHLLVEGNDITGVNENGSHNDAFQVVWGGDHLIFRNNYVHDDNGQGFFIKDGRVTDVTFANNVFVNNRGQGEQFTAVDVIGLRMYNNTFWSNQAGAVIWGDTRNVVMRNNIFDRLDGQWNGDMRATMASTVQDHNIIAGGNGRWSKRGPHDSSRRPTFVNPGARDYRLARGSAGIDAGTADGAPARDKACRARYDSPGVPNRGTGSPPFVDIGALEYGPAGRPGDTAASGCGSARPQRGGHHHAHRARPRVRVLGARLGRQRVVVTVRARHACRIGVRGRGSWRAHGHRHGARLRRQTRGVHAHRATTLRLRAPGRLRHAGRHARVTLHLTLTLRSCGGGGRRTVHRAVRLRH